MIADTNTVPGVCYDSETSECNLPPTHTLIEINIDIKFYFCVYACTYMYSIACTYQCPNEWSSAITIDLQTDQLFTFCNSLFRKYSHWSAKFMYSNNV